MTSEPLALVRGIDAIEWTDEQGQRCRMEVLPPQTPSGE